MKPKNIMLLGFVNKAVEYLDKYMDEEPNTRLTELKNVDLDSLKGELSDTLDASLGTMESTMATLLKAGNEAFDKFIEDTVGKKESIPSQFNRIFDVDLDSDKKDNQDELARLLSFYNLENDFEVEENNEIGTTGEQAPAQEDVMLDEIRKNVTSDNTQEIVPIEHDNVNNEEIDSIFTEIVENENKTEAFVEVPIENETKEVESARVISKDKESESIEKKNEYEYKPIVNPGIEQIIADEAKENIEPKEEYTEVQVENVETQDNNVEEIKDDVNETQSYVSSLIDDLREQLVKEEASKQQVDKNRDVYDHIAKIYPYLSQGFIRSVYELKGDIANEYPFDREVIVLHRVKFNDVDNLRKFVEIALNHNYSINADEDKMIVDIFREFVNGDGKILTNIYEIANQGCLLDGIYEGYNVIVQED